MTSTAPMSQRRAVIELVLGSSIWGFGFIATRWALDDMGPIWLSAARFLLAAVIGLGVMVLVPSLRPALSWEQLKLALPPGVFLGASLILQTVGLVHTTATNSGFITTLYVLFVPLLGWVALKHELRRGHLVCVAIALVGTALICGLDRAEVNVGDLLTLGCALLGAVHLLWLSAIGKKIGSPLAFNVYQSLWAGAITLVVAVPFEPLGAMPGMRALGGLAFLIVGSTLIAFMLQVRAQRVLPASLASLLCLLESPFAAVFAFALLSERLGGMQWIGAFLILAASAAAVRLEAAGNQSVQAGVRNASSTRSSGTEPAPPKSAVPQGS